MGGQPIRNARAYTAYYYRYPHMHHLLGQRETLCWSAITNGQWVGHPLTSSRYIKSTEEHYRKPKLILNAIHRCLKCTLVQEYLLCNFDEMLVDYIVILHWTFPFTALRFCPVSNLFSL